MRRTVLVAVLAALVTTIVAVPIVVYASHQFTDVPNTNPFHADIDWLADAGVTKGCSTTQYCPKDNVTREQMAAFMRRLSGNDGGVAPSVNADKVDGYNLAQFAPRAAFNNTTDAPDGADYTLSTTVTAPARGILIISGGVNAFNVGFKTYGCSIQVDDVTVTGSHMTSQLNGNGTVNEQEDCTTSGAKTVGPGTHTVDLEVSSVDTGTDLFGSSVWVLWIPFDGNGNTP